MTTPRIKWTIDINMNVEEALAFVDELFRTENKPPMKDLERAVFRGSWQGKRYKEIYRDCSDRCSLDHLMRNVAPELWKRLSAVLGEKVNKGYLQGPIEKKAVESHGRSQQQQVETPQLAPADAARSSVTTPDYSRNGKLLHTLQVEAPQVAPADAARSSVTTPDYWCNGKLRRTLTKHTDGVGSVAISPDGQTLASGSWDKTIKLWDLQTGKHRRTITGHSEDVASVMFLDEQTLVSASYDLTLKLWYGALELADEIKAVNIYEHHDRIECLALHPKQPVFASGSFDGKIKVWKLHLGHRELVTTLGGDSAAVISLAFSPDGWTLVGGFMDGTIKLWDLRTQKHPRTLSNGSEWVPTVAFSPDGQILFSGSKKGSISLWNLDTEKLGTFEGHSGAILSLAISPYGEILASSSWDNTINLWHWRNGTRLHTLNGHADGASCVTFSPDGRTLVSGDGKGTIKIWQGVS